MCVASCDEVTAAAVFGNLEPNLRVRALAPLGMFDWLYFAQAKQKEIGALLRKPQLYRSKYCSLYDVMER